MRATFLSKFLFGCRSERGLKLFVVLGVLAIGSVPSCFGQESPRPITERLTVTASAAAQSLPAGTQEKASQPEKNPPEQGAEATDDVLHLIQSELDVVHVPEPQALAGALGVAINPKGGTPADSPTSSLEVLGDLDGDGISEVALKWLLPDLADQDFAEATAPRGSWRLFLLAWDGQRWQASGLGSPAESLRFQVVRLGNHSRLGIVVVVNEGEDAVPYPAVYQVKDHAASLVWDGKADESRYEGYLHGRVEFHDTAAGDLTEMIAVGRADPGLLVFPKESRRGFEVRSTYHWDGQGYVPVKTEYASTPDYTLYRFIATLHLHDFRGAYAVIDPPKFLNTDSPTLDKFRQLVEDSWPEFLDDKVFEALDAKPDSPDPYTFILGEKDKKFVYHPRFTPGAKALLTGLERQEEK